MLSDDEIEAVNRLALITVETARYARGSEAVLAVLNFMPPISDALIRLVEIAPEVTPELQVALDHLQETGEALKRAATFLTAQYEVLTASKPL